MGWSLFLPLVILLSPCFAQSKLDSFKPLLISPLSFSTDTTTTSPSNVTLSSLFAQTYTKNQLPGLFGAAIGVFLVICVVGMILNRIANASSDRRLVNNLASRELIELDKLDRQGAAQ
jgi:hypothetical protein